MAEQFADDGFRFESTTRPYARLVPVFYHEYARVFVLPDERETLAGFRICLSLNGTEGETLRRRFGPSREYIGVLRTPGGQIAAGVNFICFPMPMIGNVVTVHSMYAFVVPRWRRHGLLRRVYRFMECVARRYGAEQGLGADAELIFVGEQNDPFRMTLDALQLDTAATGINQFDRIAIWGRLGARILAFHYIQLALSTRGASDETLFLRVLYSDEQEDHNPVPVRLLDPRILREHLRRFFGITVLKGRSDPDLLPEAAAQEKTLEQAIAEGRSIPAHKMPAQRTLQIWKARAALLVDAVNHPAQQSIGSQLGIASILDTRQRNGGSESVGSTTAGRLFNRFRPNVRTTRSP